MQLGEIIRRGSNYQGKLFRSLSGEGFSEEFMEMLKFKDKEVKIILGSSKSRFCTLGEDRGLVRQMPNLSRKKGPVEEQHCGRQLGVLLAMT